MTAALTWGYNQVATRVTNFASAGQQAYLGAISAALTVINAAGDVAAFRTMDPAMNGARNSANFLNHYVANTYADLLKTINPNAKFVNSTKDATRNAQNQWIENHPTANGRLSISDTCHVLRPLAIKQQAMMNSLNQGNWLNRHVTARLAAPLSAVVMIVAAAVRTVLGVIAAIFSIITLGCSRTLNTWAWHGLNTPGFMINQLQHGILGFFRPSLV
jgi:hypothetical protein